MRVLSETGPESSKVVQNGESDADQGKHPFADSTAPFYNEADEAQDGSRVRVFSLLRAGS